MTGLESKVFAYLSLPKMTLRMTLRMTLAVAAVAVTKKRVSVSDTGFFGKDVIQTCLSSGNMMCSSGIWYVSSGNMAHMRCDTDMSFSGKYDTSFSDERKNGV